MARPKICIGPAESPGSLIARALGGSPQDNAPSGAGLRRDSRPLGRGSFPASHARRGRRLSDARSNSRLSLPESTPSAVGRKDEVHGVGRKSGHLEPTRLGDRYDRIRDRRQDIAPGLRSHFSTTFLSSNLSTISLTLSEKLFKYESVFSLRFLGSSSKVFKVYFE
mgnify:CR=1 FL=1